MQVLHNQIRQVNLLDFFLEVHICFQARLFCCLYTYAINIVFFNNYSYFLLSHMYNKHSKASTKTGVPLLHRLSDLFLHTHGEGSKPIISIA